MYRNASKPSLCSDKPNKKKRKERDKKEKKEKKRKEKKKKKNTTVQVETTPKCHRPSCLIDPTESFMGK